MTTSTLIPSFLRNKTVVPDNFNLDEHSQSADLSGKSFESIAREYGTPLYLLDEATILNTIKSYQDAYSGYPKKVNLMYACKANCNKGLLKRVVDAGMGLDLVSGGELATALAAGISANVGLLNGNNKSPEELEEAIQNGIRFISVDNAYEIEMIAAIAERLGKVVDILLRITPGIECHTHDYIKTGSVDSKFGFGLKELPQVIEWVLTKQSNTMRLCGLHAHIGSQIFEQQPYLDLADLILGWYDNVRQQHGHVMTHLNLGGGIGIAYTEADDPLELSQVGHNVTQAVIEACQKRNYPLPELILEPGRSTIGRAGMTLYTVGSIKYIPELDKTYVAVNGGMGDNIRPALYQAVYSAVVVNRIGEPCTKKVSIAGKYCESGDVLFKELMVPESIQSGDLLLVFSTGAYNYAMSSQYNRVPRPAMIIANTDGSVSTLIQRETYEDTMRLDHV